MIQYSTILKEADAVQEIEKSKFITHVKPVETRAEADEFIAGIKKKYKDATHNVPAMVIGDKFQIQWASDDGEPQGTSGAPIVQMLVKEGITNVAVVVTRYFGGIKLGTGGLVRAYTSSAKLGIIAGEICDVNEMIISNYKIEYSYLSKLQNLAGEGLFQIGNIEYEDVIKIEIIADPEKNTQVQESVSNLTKGLAVLENQRSQLVKVKK
ncbi:MAG: YigZ family protein [Eubacteriales bacterium]|nr:YigZ family protein [Eubacteriales bacterium]